MIISNEEMLRLPKRDWGKCKKYKSLLICPTGAKHISGYSNMAIIGLDTQVIETLTKGEFAAECDDINWISNNSSLVRTDMLFPSGIIHIWGRFCEFKVGKSLSSTTVEIQYANF